MSDAPYIPFYPSDWLAGTRGLTAAETGVYITLIALMYEKQEPLVMDLARLARLCGLPKAGFVRSVDVLLSEGKISKKGDGYWNLRVEKELSERVKKIEKTRSVKSKAANARWKKSQQNQCKGDARAMHMQCKPEPDIYISNDIYKKGENFDAEFDEFWKAYPKRDGTNSRKRAKEKYLVAIKGGATHETLLAGAKGYAKYAATLQEKKYIKQTETWLTARLWEQYAESEQQVTQAPKLIWVRRDNPPPQFGYTQEWIDLAAKQGKEPHKLFAYQREGSSPPEYGQFIEAREKSQ